jgi:hypothetical protein
MVRHSTGTSPLEGALLTGSGVGFTETDRAVALTAISGVLASRETLERPDISTSSAHLEERAYGGEDLRYR